MQIKIWFQNRRTKWKRKYTNDVELLAQQYYSSLGIPAPRPIFVGDRLWQVLLLLLKKILTSNFSRNNFIFLGFSIAQDKHKQQLLKFYLHTWATCLFHQVYQWSSLCQAIFQQELKTQSFETYHPTTEVFIISLNALTFEGKTYEPQNKIIIIN